MKILQKTICSLLISGAVFAACVVSGVKGGFKSFEMNFFRPRVESAITEKLERVSDSFVNYSSSLSAKFRAFMKEEAVCSYIERSPSSNVLQKRNALENGLFASVPGLEGFSTPSLPRAYEISLFLVRLLPYLAHAQQRGASYLWHESRPSHTIYRA